MKIFIFIFFIVQLLNIDNVYGRHVRYNKNTKNNKNTINTKIMYKHRKILESINSLTDKTEENIIHSCDRYIRHYDL